MNVAELLLLMDRPLRGIALGELRAVRDQLAAARADAEQRLTAVEAAQGRVFDAGSQRPDTRGQVAAARQLVTLDAEADGLAARLRITHKQLLLLDRLIYLRETLDAVARLHRAAPAAVPLDWQRLVEDTAPLPDETRLDELTAALDAAPPPLIARRALDGGTLELLDGRIVRYIGVDSPALVNALGRPDAGAEAARDANDALVAGQPVRLEADALDADADGCLWRYVYVAGPRGERMVNRELIALGCVYHAQRYPNSRHIETLLAAEQDARRRGRGVWHADARR